MSTPMVMVYAIVISGLVAIAALCAEAACAHLRVARRWTWVLAIIASVAAPVVASRSVMPARDAFYGWPPERTTAEWLASGNDDSALSVMISSLPVVNGRFEAIERLTGDNETLWRGAALLSLLIVPLCVLRDAIILTRRRRVWRADAVDGVQVLLSPDFGPAVVGLVTPAIVVPAAVASLPASARRLLLEHEQQHVRAHDGRLTFAMLCVLALMPWNLVLWWQFVRLRAAIELDCDARVLQRHGDRRAYGTLLIEMASRSHRMPFAVTPFMERFQHALARRIHALTNAARPYRRARAVAMLVGAGGMLAIATALPRPAVGQSRQLEAPNVQESVVIAMLQANRTGQWANAEQIGSAWLAANGDVRKTGEGCAIHIGVTYALARQQKSVAAKASMAQFDSLCTGVTYSDWFPGEADRVRRVVAGEDPGVVYRLPPAKDTSVRFVPRTDRFAPKGFLRW